MSERLAYLLISALFLSLFCTSRFGSVASATTIVVPTDFPTIQSAIDNAAPGDTIFVHEGVYSENVVVDKTVSVVGEDKNTTKIDGGGSGVVIRIIAENVSLSGVTVQNSGSEAYESGIFVESSFSNISGNIIAKNGLTGIYLNNSFGSSIVGNIIAENGGDAVFLVDSSNNVLFNNVVTGNNGGIRLYSSNENNISRNVVNNNLAGGIYLFYSSHNSLYGNVVRNNKDYGLKLDYSSNLNTVVNNSVVDNLKHGLVLGSVSGNTLRNNNMSGNQFNFHAVVYRFNLEDYLNDVDPSNHVDGKEIQYITTENDLVINSTSYSNIGYLALINSTRVTVEGLNLTSNGQALLLAFTSNSTLENLYVSNNNNGIQLCSSTYITIRNCTIANNSADGLTFEHYSSNNTVIGNFLSDNKLGLRAVHSCRNNTFSRNSVTNNDIGMRIYSYSSDNVITENVVVNNGIGISLQRVSPTKIIGNMIADNDQGLFLETSENLIYHNNFVNNTVQVATSNSTSIWDLDYLNGGNHWSDYEGEDANCDGIGDVPYVVDDSNSDRYPLMNSWTVEDEEPPAIGFPTLFPSGDIQPYEETTVCVAVTDVGVGVKNVTLFYAINNSVSWVELKMSHNSTTKLFVTVLSGQPVGTLVKYKIVAFDSVENVAVKDNSGLFFTYQVIPEFNSPILLFILSTTTIIVLFAAKILHRKKSAHKKL